MTEGSGNLILDRNKEEHLTQTVVDEMSFPKQKFTQI